MDLDLILWWLAADHHLDEFHHIAVLIEDPDVWIRHVDGVGVRQIGSKKLFECDALLVLHEGAMAGFRLIAYGRLLGLDFRLRWLIPTGLLCFIQIRDILAPVEFREFRFFQSLNCDLGAIGAFI